MNKTQYKHSVIAILHFYLMYLKQFIIINYIAYFLKNVFDLFSVFNVPEVCPLSLGLLLVGLSPHLCPTPIEPQENRLEAPLEWR